MTLFLENLASEHALEQLIVLLEHFNITKGDRAKMNAEIFRQTESLLNRYCKKKMRIERLHSIIQLIHDQAEEIKQELAEATPVPRLISVYRSDGGAAVPVGGFGGSGIKGLDTAIDKYNSLLVDLQARYLELRRREWLLRLRARRLEEEIAGIDAVVGQLDEDERRIVEFRYLYRWSNYAIGKEMRFDERTIRRKHQAIVFKVADSLAITKNAAKTPH
jgi:hypothetical protein